MNHQQETVSNAPPTLGGAGRVPTAMKIAVSVHEAVAMSGRSRSRLYRALKTGELVARKDGRATVIIVSELEAWLRALPAYEPGRDPVGNAA